MKRILLVLALLGAMFVPATSTPASASGAKAHIVTNCPGAVPAFTTLPTGDIVATFSGALIPCTAAWAPYMTFVNNNAELMSLSYNPSTGITTMLFHLR